MSEQSTQEKQAEIKPEYFQVAKQGIDALANNVRSVITIHPQKLQWIIASKLAGGHVILADAHGVGKTSLARALAGSISWESNTVTAEGVELDPFNRVQCTVDLLPQDILGFNRYDMKSGQQIFNRGPIFAHFVLCDEINLLTPKSQGSFLQVMEERMVTIEGRSYKIPDPFFIIATMNLRGAHLFPLPAPQLDRFMIRISLGYPEEKDEIDIITKHGRMDGWAGFKPVVGASELMAWQRLVDAVTIRPEVVAYIVRLMRKTRSYPGIISGASPRSGIRMSRLARALALVRGLNYVTVDVVKELAIPVLSHRLELEDPTRSSTDLIMGLLNEIKV